MRADCLRKRSLSKWGLTRLLKVLIAIHQYSGFNCSFSMMDSQTSVALLDLFERMVLCSICSSVEECSVVMMFGLSDVDVKASTSIAKSCGTIFERLIHQTTAAEYYGVS